MNCFRCEVTGAKIYAAYRLLKGDEIVDIATKLSIKHRTIYWINVLKNGKQQVIRKDIVIAEK